MEFVLRYWRIYFCAEELPIIVVKFGNMLMLVCGIWLYQKDYLSLGMLVWVGTIGDLLAEQLKDLCTRFLRRMANHTSYTRMDEFDAAETEKILEILNIDFRDKQVTTKPLNLSFGEQQKIFLARALNRKSEYLILDEPTINLDIDTKQKMINYLVEIAKKKAVVLISHEAEFEMAASYLYKIENGELLCVK